MTNENSCLTKSSTTTVPPPLYCEEMILKQLDTSTNSDEELVALDLAFPVFRQLDTDLFFPGGWTSAITGMGSRTVFVGRGRERRYAGDKTLERARYWSICVDQKGFDNSNLTNEIRAYHGYMSRSDVYIFDTTCDFERLDSFHNDKAFDLEIVLEIAQQQFGSSDAPFLLLMITPLHHNDKIETAKMQLGKSYIFLYGLRVEEQRVEKLFDLRRADCRHWLLKEFLPLEIAEGKQRRASENIRLIGKEPPVTIEELFPILLSPEIGGANPFIQALGSWLRSHGCNGIVFPSARSDFSVCERNGSLEDFSGWNFVDFRGATSAPWREHIGHIHSFNIHLGEQFSIEFTESKQLAEVRAAGLLQQNIGRFNTMRHHAREGTDPNILDLADGFLSILDISQETLAKPSSSEVDEV